VPTPPPRTMRILVVTIANLAMVAVMTVAPVDLHDHGAAMGTIGLPGLVAAD
jgi:hypothetical protein